MSYGFSMKVDPTQLKDLTDKLDGLYYKAPTVMKNAANATGKAAVKMLEEDWEQRYAYERSDTLKDYLKTKSATYANPRYVISAKTNMEEIINFDVTDRSPERWFGYSVQSVGHVRRDTAREPLVNEFGNKAFVTQFKNGHISVVARVGEGRKVKSFSSPSFSHMAARSYEEIEPAVQEMLRANTEKQIRKVMDRANG